jgi:hypothetical protein
VEAGLPPQAPVLPAALALAYETAGRWLGLAAPSAMRWQPQKGYPQSLPGGQPIPPPRGRLASRLVQGVARGLSSLAG